MAPGGACASNCSGSPARARGRRRSRTCASSCVTRNRATATVTTWSRGEQLLETLSGGEGVWIRAAISAAIGRVRAERTGVEWRTVLLDEADAGLDEGAADNYWRLVEAAHAVSGRHHTVAITHSGAQHAFAQRIEMGGA